MSSEESPKIRQNKPLWLKAIIWLTACAGTLAVTVVAVLCLIVWLLTPDVLTPLVEKYANEYLNAEVSVKRVELTLRKTFPRLELSVDSLVIVSNGLDGVSEEKRAALPMWADTLTSIPHMNGGINITSLIAGQIDIYDVELTCPTINVVYADSLTSNLNIMPPDSLESESNEFPAFNINRFEITGEAPIRYFSQADSINVELVIKSSALTSAGLPVYKIESHAIANADIGAELSDINLNLGLDGIIHWNPEHPYIVSLSDFSVSANDVKSVCDLTVELTDTLPIIQKFDIKLSPTKLTELINLLPETYIGDLKSIRSDMSVTGRVWLLKPYAMASDELPCVAMSLDIPDGTFNYGQIRILQGGITADCEIIGDSLKASFFNIKRLHARGRAMDLEMTAKIKEPFHDPLVTGRFNGHITLSLLHSALKKLIPAQISGTVRGNTDFRFRMSQLNMRSIHKIKMNGRLLLTDLNVIDTDSMSIYMHRAELKLGTNNSLTRNSIRTDSLLTLSAKIDSAWIMTDELYTRCKDFNIGLGCKNTASMLDTTSITPIGATIHAESLYYRSHVDSMRMFIRDMNCGAVLTRFKGEAKVPLLGMRASLNRAFISDNQMRIALRDGSFDITAHLNPKSTMSQRMKARYDSISAANPGISADSVRQIMIERYRRSRTDSDAERMSLALDQGTASILRRLDLKGSLSAASGRIVTPMFPLRNKFENLDCHFNTDSLILRNAEFSAGESDLTISGTVSNIRNTLAYTRSRKPLRIDLTLDSDTFNVNQLTQAVFKGMLAAQNHDTMTPIVTDDENDTLIQDSIMSESEQLEGAVLIPVNVAADIKVNARNVIYADVPMHDFHGSLLVENGALNLRDLSARTDIGSASMNALYYAPRKSDIMFGMGLKLNDFHIGKVVQIIPQIDSIMPILNGISGIIDVNLATTTRIDSLMNFDLPSLKAALQMQGDSLVVLDPETYKTMAKWLMFKDKNNNMINHMEVEMVVENSTLELYPFMFDFDRYRLGVMGSNDLAMNLNYHVAVLKSPLPFKFGINITGTADDMKIRVGKAKFKENMVGERVAIADTTRINLIAEIDQVFKRGINAARLAPLKLQRPTTIMNTPDSDTITQTDSVILINEGLIEATITQPDTVQPDKNDKKNRKKRK